MLSVHRCAINKVDNCSIIDGNICVHHIWNIIILNIIPTISLITRVGRFQKKTQYHPNISQDNIIIISGISSQSSHVIKPDIIMIFWIYCDIIVMIVIIYGYNNIQIFPIIILSQ